MQMPYVNFTILFLYLGTPQIHCYIMLSTDWENSCRYQLSADEETTAGCYGNRFDSYRLDKAQMSEVDLTRICKTTLIKRVS